VYNETEGVSYILENNNCSVKFYLPDLQDDNYYEYDSSLSSSSMSINGSNALTISLYAKSQFIDATNDYLNGTTNSSIKYTINDIDTVYDVTSTLYNYNGYDAYLYDITRTIEDGQVSYKLFEVNLTNCVLGVTLNSEEYESIFDNIIENIAIDSVIQDADTFEMPIISSSPSHIDELISRVSNNTFTYKVFEVNGTRTLVNLSVDDDSDLTLKDLSMGNSDTYVLLSSPTIKNEVRLTWGIEDYDNDLRLDLATKQELGNGISVYTYEDNEDLKAENKLLLYGYVGGIQVLGTDEGEYLGYFTIELNYEDFDLVTYYLSTLNVEVYQE
jgi:hypothetical protein